MIIASAPHIGNILTRSERENAAININEQIWHGMRIAASMTRIRMPRSTTPNNDRSVGERYTADELAEFASIIRTKLDAAQEDLRMATGSLSRQGANDTKDTYAGTKGLEEGNPSQEREELMMLATRQQKFIMELNLALERIRSGNYGICRVSGEKIPKERLRLVPHATMSIVAKQEQASGA